MILMWFTHASSGYKLTNCIKILYWEECLCDYIKWLFVSVLNDFLATMLFIISVLEFNGWIFCLFAEHQERLKVIHDKFKEEVNQHLLDCRSILEELEAYNLELKGTADLQSVWRVQIRIWWWQSFYIFVLVPICILDCSLIVCISIRSAYGDGKVFIFLADSSFQPVSCTFSICDLQQ